MCYCSHCCSSCCDSSGSHCKGNRISAQRPPLERGLYALYPCKLSCSLLSLKLSILVLIRLELYLFAGALIFA
jgi:hypothetical protein